jgi:hypothetical protein
MVPTISQKETVDLLNKCWMTHDGMWFFHCLQTVGIEATNKLNKAAIQSLSSIEIQRLKKALGNEKTIDNECDFEIFFNAASKLMIPDFMNVTFSFSKHSKLMWEFVPGKCFAYAGIKRIGVIDTYECGVLFRIKCWLEALGIKHRFNPEVKLCLMHQTGNCSGEIQLFF